MKDFQFLCHKLERFRASLYITRGQWQGSKSIIYVSKKFQMKENLRYLLVFITPWPPITYKLESQLLSPPTLLLINVPLYLLRNIDLIKHNLFYKHSVRVDLCTSQIILTGICYLPPTHVSITLFIKAWTNKKKTIKIFLLPLGVDPETSCWSHEITIYNFILFSLLFKGRPTLMENVKSKSRLDP